MAWLNVVKYFVNLNFACLFAVQRLYFCQISAHLSPVFWRIGYTAVHWLYCEQTKVPLMIGLAGVIWVFQFFFARLVTQWWFNECFSLADGFKIDSFCAGRVALWANEIFRLKMEACVNWGSLVLCKSTCTVQMNGFSYDWVTCGTWCLSGLLQK